MLCHVMFSIEAMIHAFIKSKRVNKIANPSFSFKKERK